MRKFLGKLLLRAAHRMGVVVLKKNTFSSYAETGDKYLNLLAKLSLLEIMAPQFNGLANMSHSKSQLGQDLFALTRNQMRPGYFIEIGATDGRFLSNTFLLEKYFSWNGVLVEPNVYWHKSLFQNRSSHISVDALWDTTGETISLIQDTLPELASVSENAILEHKTAPPSAHSRKLLHTTVRKIFSVLSGEKNDLEIKNVRTITFQSLFEKFDVPQRINYISLDIEGAEYRVLSQFPFQKYTVDVWTIEHNFREDREEICKLLIKNNYIRVFEDISSHDDWFVRDTLA